MLLNVPINRLSYRFRVIPITHIRRDIIPPQAINKPESKDLAHDRIINRADIPFQPVTFQHDQRLPGSYQGLKIHHRVMFPPQRFFKLHDLLHRVFNGA